MANGATWVFLNRCGTRSAPSKATARAAVAVILQENQLAQSYRLPALEAASGARWSRLSNLLSLVCRKFSLWQVYADGWHVFPMIWAQFRSETTFLPKEALRHSLFSFFFGLFQLPATRLLRRDVNMQWVFQCQGGTRAVLIHSVQLVGSTPTQYWHPCLICTVTLALHVNCSLLTNTWLLQKQEGLASARKTFSANGFHCGMHIKVGLQSFRSMRRCCSRRPGKHATRLERQYTGSMEKPVERLCNTNGSDTVTVICVVTTCFGSRSCCRSDDTFWSSTGVK